MNRIRIQRLGENEREKYIRDGLAHKEMSELRHMVTEYGIKGSLSMTRRELEDVIVDALCTWASNGHSLPTYKDETLLPVPEYEPQGNTCALSGCKQTIFRGGICSKHHYEYVETITGTYHHLWIEALVSKQRSFERKTFNSEMPFSWMEDGGEYLIG